MTTPHSRQMSFGIGHQIGSEIGFNVDDVRQHMDNLYVQRDPNYLDRSVTPVVRKLTPAFGDIVLWHDIRKSDYSAFLVGRDSPPIPRRPVPTPFCRARGNG